ncbi:MAG: molybdenum cofactor guanylyltransferase [Cyanobacteria bacterium CAN_BIN43]|nr:molybdenum cofactor guanylyltransferase [Cyanobacteria bacterium CAN_BIN43]
MDNSPNSQLSAIVLAGGLSSRMGQDKALIEIDQVPLLSKICQVALQCADPVYVVTPWVERYRAVVDRQVQFIQEVPLSNEPNEPDKPNGSLVGFVQGLAIVQTEWVLLLACDLPGLRGEILQDWAARLSKVEGAIALLPKNPEGYWEPLCGFYRQDCLPSLQAYIATGKRSFQGWLAQQPVQAVQELLVSDRQMLLNCNTPEDLQIFRPN